MNDFNFKSMTTEQLARILDTASYFGGLCDGTGDKADARQYNLDAINACTELRSRIRQLEKSAEHSADRWQTRAESAEARVEELIEENARLEQEAAEVTEDYRVSVDSAGRVGAVRDYWRGRAVVAEAERNEAIRRSTAVPRVIRPDEVREGQTVAIRWADGSWGVRESISDQFAQAGRALLNPSKTVVLLSEGGDD